MAKKSEEEAAEVKVVLKCILSGLENETPGPGDVISVEAEEAARLIEIGAATAYTEPATDGDPA